MGKIEQNTGSLWQDFESHLISRNYAPNTINAYRWDVTQFTNWLDNRQGLIQALAPTDITDYLSQLTEDGVAPSSRGRKLFAIRSFLQFLVDTQHLTENPAAGVKAPKLDTRQRRVLSEMEYRRLRDVVRNESVRDYAIIELVLQTGLRVSEVCNLRYPDDLAFSSKTVHGSVTVRDTKSRKDRVIPINSVAERAIASYLLERAADAATNHLFLTNRKTPMNQPLLSRLLKRYFRLADISGASFHTLRHTFATHSLGKGTNIVVIKETLGHKHLTTTEKYLHFIRERQVEELERNAL